MIQKRLTADLKTNPKNPRKISKEKLEDLKKSLKELPQMLELRPIVIDEEGYVLGGNQRLEAAKALGLKEVPTILVDDMTEEQKEKFIIKDNGSWGEWDFSQLESWDKEILLSGGFDKFDLIGIFGENDLDSKFNVPLEKSSFNPEVVNVDDYIKQNIFFFNEMMLEFRDDEVKESLKNISAESFTKESFERDLKKLIIQYGKNPL